MIVYLGAAIDTSLGSPADQFNELGNTVIKAAGEKSVILFNPYTAFMNAHAISTDEDMQFLINTNNQALDASDLAVFSWTTSPSMGVPLEIQRRKLSKEPLIVWNRTPKKLGIYLRQGLDRNQIVVDSIEELSASLESWFKHPASLLVVVKPEPPHKAEALPAPMSSKAVSEKYAEQQCAEQQHKKNFMREQPPKVRV